MPRYDERDRHGGNSTRLYVGHLHPRTRSRDLDDVFSRYGRVRDVDLKQDFAFIEFSDPRDADDARHGLNGRQVGGNRIVVEFAKGVPRGAASSRDREYLGRGPPPGSGRCFNCGLDGHWARDCKAGDWKNKCYRCGERGHIERNCQNSPKSLKRGKSYSRSLSRSPPRRGRSRSFSRSRSYSRSRSPPPTRRERSLDREEKRSISPRYSRSPEPKKSSPPPSKGRKRSLTPGEDSPQERRIPPSKPKQEGKRDGSDSESPRGNSRSPSPEKESPVAKRYESPSETNGHSPRNDRSPMDDDGENGSPRGSGSPNSQD